MYKFRDVNEASDNILPSEALQLNGKFIEDLIPGYRTLNVSGREMLSPELDYFETGVRDGSTLRSKRYPARIITVKYQLVTNSAEDFREAFNELAGILNVEDAELIFNDEPDKFYTGTIETIKSINPGLTSVVSEFSFFCADPFKYSVKEYTAEPNVKDGSILIDYKGTYKSFPILRAEFCSEDEAEGTLWGRGDCGYVAFYNENEKIIQLGDPKEEDEEEYPASQTLINQKFSKETSWGVAAKDLWTINAGKMLPNDSAQQIGALGMRAASYEYYDMPETSITLLNKRKSTGAKPTMYYTLTAKSYDRAADSVKVKIALSVQMASKTNYFSGKRNLKASVQVGGDWYTWYVFKEGNSKWVGTQVKSFTKVITLTGLSADQTALPDIKFKAERDDDTGGTSGTVESTNCKDIPISRYIAPTPETWFLNASDYGTASSVWHGVTMSRAIPTDATGDTGAANFEFTWKQKMCIGKSETAQKQKGDFQIYVLNKSNKIVAGVRIRKNANGKTAILEFYVNSDKVNTVNIDLSYNNKYFGNNTTTKSTVKTSSIRKVGRTIYFNIGGYKYNFIDWDLSSQIATKVSVGFGQYSTTPALHHNGLYWVKFVKNNCEQWEDIPNKFSTDDVVEADCKTGEVRLNNKLAPELGALGNDWEEFCLTPGLNQIGFSYSDWVEDIAAPTCSVKYREVFL